MDKPARQPKRIFSGTKGLVEEWSSRNCRHKKILSELVSKVKFLTINPKITELYNILQGFTNHFHSIE